MDFMIAPKVDQVGNWGVEKKVAEKIRGILSVLCGLSGEMVWKAHEHSHSRKLLPQKKRIKINRALSRIHG
jgi:hypothetical protein